ncbi:DUF2237 family protein [Chitinimonas sp. BJB300]|uniref:DUF2237 family protein n=1 Tax=Chitinimonas sp. BJB300 TaxID=1559339 RepID=UPI000C0D66F4|nr:DUF2237 domain-containing protein [Chitinimonas sp. BJB300]PHV12174.1 hypothetical protein CSQ89_06890 [Chitinimonas sp. BJB300]TSJ91579.1 DUF2237 domain-containing protein [Chitinimonas sp. BJB300]
MQASINVLGQPLLSCSMQPLIGFFRDGCCNTGHDDTGRHTVCVQVTQTFLNFSTAQGNDLVTPRPEYGFSGLEPGNFWCLCAGRWIEALLEGVAAPIRLAATHEDVLELVSLETLVAHALDRP